MRRLALACAIALSASRCATAQKAIHIDRQIILPTEGHLDETLRDISQASYEYLFSRNVQFHVKYQSDSQRGSITMIVKAARGGAVYQIPLTSDGGDIWTRPLPKAGTISLTADYPLKEHTVVVDAALVDGPGSQTQALTPPSDDREWIRGEASSIQDLGSSVAKLRWIGDDRLLHSCTGFLISESLLITNEHCMRSSAEIKKSYAFFDYISDVDDPQIIKIADQLFVDAKLDISVYLLSESIPGRRPLKWSPSSSSVKTGEAVILIEHAAGLPKQVSIVDCRILDTSMPGLSPLYKDFGHFCDTLGGSSGSPIVDFSTGLVMGIHHNAIDEDQVVVNQGIKIDDIRVRLLASGVPAIVTAVQGVSR